MEKFLEIKALKNIWIQPAAGDAGGALGCALAYWHQELNKPRQAQKNDSMRGSYLGPQFNRSQIEQELDSCRAKYHTVSSEEMFEQVSEALSKGKAVGWFQGRMEFGPRALGARSILGDPRSESMQKKL